MNVIGIDILIFEPPITLLNPNITNKVISKNTDIYIMIDTILM